MRILVTGASGQIGSLLGQRLPHVFPEAEIILIDLKPLVPKGRPLFFNGDILDFDFESFLRKEDYVIHLAALTDAAESFEKPDLYRLINTEGTGRIASACGLKRARLFFPSTTSIYGRGGGIDPQTPYALSKWEAEKILRDLGLKQNLNYTIGRLGSVFGYSPAMHFHTAIHKFCLQAVRGEPLGVWKTALKQTRPYLELTDCVRAMEFVLQRDLFQQCEYDIFSLQASVQQVLDEIKSGIANLKIDFMESPAMNDVNYLLENTKFSSLGFEFMGSLKHSIPEIIQRLFKRLRILEAVSPLAAVGVKNPTENSSQNSRAHGD